nr:hypothetical protein [Tanacetum cinerariifolium]
MAQNIDFSGSDQIQNPQYPLFQENPLTNDEFKAYTKANDDNINNLQIKLDHFQKKVEQKQDGFLNQMRNFMQNLYDGPPGVDKEHKATTDTELPSTEDIQPLSVHEPPQDSDIFVPILSTKEPEHLLSMGYEHLSITPKTESNEVTESNAKNLLPIPSECEVTLEDEIECDMPAKDDCSPNFTIFSNPLFDNDDLDSSDDESLPDEDVLAEEFKIYLNPLFDEDEINSDKLDLHCFNDGNSQKEEIDIVTKTDDVLPTSVENDDDLEDDIRFLEALLIDDSIPFPNIESFNFKDNPSLPQPPPKPSDVRVFL